MSRSTSGNENKNKAAVYGKRHEGKSSDAAFESGVRNFAGTLRTGVTFLPLCVCVRALCQVAAAVCTGSHWDSSRSSFHRVKSL